VLLAALVLLVPTAQSATLVVNNTTDVINGDTTNPTTLASNPGPDGISLIEAVTACNNVPGPNSIVFDPSLAGQTIVLTSGFTVKQDGISITGLVGSDGSPAVTLDMSQAFPYIAFNLLASDFTLKWIRVVGQSSVDGLSISAGPGEPQTINNVLVEGNVFIGASGDTSQGAVGMRFVPGATNASISNVSIIGNKFINFPVDGDGVGFGIITQSCTFANITIKGNYFENIENAIEIAVTGGATNSTISGTVITQNTFHECGNAMGVGISDFPDTQPTSGNVVSNTTMSQNLLIDDVQHGITLAGGGGNTSNNQILNTLIVNNLITGGQEQPPIDITAGYSDSLGSGQGNAINGVSIINNTIAYNQPYYTAIDVQPGPIGNTLSGITLTNDILWQNANGDIFGVPFGSVTNCITSDYGYGGFNGNIDADPQFVDPANGDFHLGAGSPAIGAGTNVGAPAFDIEGRPRSPNTDLGAYQFNPVPVIINQPQSQAVALGGSAVLTVGAVGPDGPVQLSYQWEQSTDGGLSWAPMADGNGVSGSGTATLSIAGIAESLDGYDYECVVTNVSGSATSSPATLIVVTPQQGQSVRPGNGVLMTVGPGGSLPLGYQWQVSTDGGDSWTTLSDGNGVSGSATANLAISSATDSLDGNEYECVITDNVGSATTTPETLTVGIPPAIEVQPSPQSTQPGNGVNFSVTASGDPEPYYTWEVSTDGGATFMILVDGNGQVSDTNDPTLRLSNIPSGWDGNEYECVITNSLGSVITLPVRLAVGTVPQITTQPTPTTETTGDSASFSVDANGFPNPTYQWQVSTNGGASFTNLADVGGLVSGSATPNLDLSNVAASLNGDEYQCVITNDVGSVTTSPVALTVDTAPSFGTESGSQTVAVGTNVSFSVIAGGNPAPSYQWQVSTNSGGNWANLADGGGVSGSSTATLDLSNVGLGLNGNVYQCVVSNSVGSATTTPATLTVGTVPAIAVQPAPETITPGSSAEFMVTAGGSPTPNYQWQVSSDGGASFTNLLDIGGAVSGSGTPNLTLTSVAAGHSGYQYDCVITNILGSTTTTRVTLTVDTPPGISVQPASQTVNAGSGVLLTVTASGSSPLGYQWDLNESPISGATGSTLSIADVQASNGGVYTVVLTDVSGEETTSNPATLTVLQAVQSNIASEPQSQTVGPGSTVVFTVGTNGNVQSSLSKVSGTSAKLSTGTTYQWQYNGSDMTDGNGISGSSGPQLVIQGTGAANDGDYACIVTTSGVATQSNSASLLVSNTSNPGALVNISSRAFVGTGDNILIGGFYIVGSTSRTVLIQALGPALAGEGVTGVLNHPALSIYNTSGLKLYSNSGWGSSQVLLNAAATVYASPVLQPNSPDSEVLLTLPPGGYTAEVSGADGGTGVALCAIYQLP
jgi:hypothetical protein